MAELKFKGFLSCSLVSDDAHVTEFFRELIGAFDIETEVYDYQDVGRLSDQVKQKIIESDCLIALATRRHKIEGSDYWSCSDWIQHEIAIAHAYGKPIAVFVEEGVQVEGLIAAEERRQGFNRDRLAGDVTKAVKFLQNLRSYLEEQRDHQLHDSPALLRHYINSHETMLSADWVVHRAEILMESLVDDLEATGHDEQIEESTENLSIRPEVFEFRCLEKPSDVTVESKVALDTDLRFFWKVAFSPPLRKGDRVKYTWKTKTPNYRPYDLAELHRRISEGTYEYEEPKCEACEWTITRPTYQLHHVFEFPEGYDIRDAHADVVAGTARLNAPKERQRIVDGGMFTAERVFDKWRLELLVSKPKMNHTYYTYYTPAT